MMKNDVFDKVLNYVKETNMMAAGDRLVAGISGGADSICLLFMLIKMQKEIPFTWTAVHVNHQLRGDEADGDQAFVEKICREHGIPCKVFSENVEAIAKGNGLSVEEAGRMVRRKCFSQVLVEENADKIVLAHHKNDNAETLLMNLSRGAGLDGLCGMRPVNQNMVRPLLCLEREEIEDWLVRQGKTWCTDSSNLSDHYTRNRVRNQILPLLKEHINERAVEHFQETMEQMQSLKDYVAVQCEHAMESCIRREDCKIVVQKSRWEKEHHYIQSEILKRCLILLAGKSKDISQVHIKDLNTLFYKQTGKRIHLLYGIVATRVYEGVVLEKDACEHIEAEPVCLQIPGTTYIPWADKTIICTVEEKDDDFSIAQKEQNPYTKWFDYDIIKNTVQIRTRQSGDILVINKDGDRQKLKSWFINEKIPASERDSVLLLAQDQDILWILGYRQSNSCLVKDTTKKILKIQVYGGNGNG